MLHVEPDTLKTEAEPDCSELEDGTRVSAETSRRLSCDSGLVRVSHALDGSILDVGRRTRTIPPALRRALETRDRGCRFPGCGLRFTDGHHVKHWAEGGETKLENLVLLCRHHHRLVHEGGWTVDWWGPGRAVFFDPRGGTHFEGGWQWPEKVAGRTSGVPVAGKLGTRGPEERWITAEEPSAPAHPVEALMEENRQEGAAPDGWTASARWEREGEIPDEASSGAWEAMLGG